MLQERRMTGIWIAQKRQKAQAEALKAEYEKRSWQVSKAADLLEDIRKGQG